MQPPKVEIPAGFATYRAAAFLDKFHYLPADLAGMTDLQMNALCAHKRTPEGALVAPEFPEPPPALPTREGRLATITSLEANGLITKANADELRAQLQ